MSSHEQNNHRDEFTPQNNPFKHIGIGFIISSGVVMDIASMQELAISESPNVAAAIGCLVLGSAIVLEGFAALKGRGLMQYMSSDRGNNNTL